MGFRSGAWATVWETESKFPTLTNGRISISKKNKETDSYEEDFSGFVAFVGTDAAKKALTLSQKDRIKLGDVEVSRKYVKESGKTYYNFKVYSFDTYAETQAADALKKSSKNTKDELPTMDDDECPF